MEVVKFTRVADGDAENHERLDRLEQPYADAAGGRLMRALAG